MNPCACCGYRSIVELDDECSVCGWTSDDYQVENPDSSVGPNGVSLRQAQQNFATLGAATSYYVWLCEPQNPLEKRLTKFEKDPNWTPLPALPGDERKQA